MVSPSSSHTFRAAIIGLFTALALATAPAVSAKSNKEKSVSSAKADKKQNKKESSKDTLAKADKKSEAKSKKEKASDKLAEKSNKADKKNAKLSKKEQAQERLTDKKNSKADKHDTLAKTQSQSDKANKKLSKAERLAQARAEREEARRDEAADQARRERQAQINEERQAAREEAAIKKQNRMAQLVAARQQAAQARQEQILQMREARRAQLALAGHGPEIGSEDENAGVLLAYAPTPRMELPSSGSFGKRSGLQYTPDPLELNSSVGYVMDANTREVLYSKNEHAVLPIASITKLMTAVVVTEAKLPMDEAITITDEDVDYLKNSSSRLKVGTTLSRGQMLLLALMSSENRAAHSLGRTFPGGTYNFVRYMNQKARELGMRDTRYADPTGLSSENQSSAKDLATLVAYAAKDTTLRAYSTSPEYAFDTGSRIMEYRNSNSLVRGGNWNIELQKTGYIREAGRCLVMQAKVAGRSLVMVLLDAGGTFGRASDAERIRQWVEASSGVRPVTASNDGGIVQVGSQPQGNLMRAMNGGY